MNLSISQRLYGMTAILLSLLIISAIINLTKMSTIGHKLVGIAEYDVPMIEALSEVTVNQLEQSIHLEKMLRYGESMRDNVSSTKLFDHAYQELFQHGEKVSKSILRGRDIAEEVLVTEGKDNPEIAETFTDALAQIEEIETHHKGFELLAKQIHDALKAEDYSKRVHELVAVIEIEAEELNSSLESLLRKIELFTENSALEAEHEEQSAITLTLIVTIISILIGATLSITIVKRINRNLTRAVDASEQIASGQLGSEIDSKDQDELGALLRSLELMRKNLHQMITQMDNSSLQVAAASEELASVSIEASGNIQQQQMEIEQAVTATTEMSSTIEEIARNAVTTSEAANEASSNTNKGYQIVEENIQSIDDLAGRLRHAGEVVQKLEKSSENIGGVLDVIKTIADQTNLLALNAAIEAARAGEQGRGFAVVADEVRTLASRTQQSTLEIEGIISSLQSGANEAVEAMNDGISRADQSVERARNAGTSLQTITEAVTHISDMNNQVATATEQQATVIEEINRNITSVSTLGTQTSSGAQQITTASEELAQLAAELQKMIGQFKL